jgi:hypothetical protein
VSLPWAAPPGTTLVVNVAPILSPSRPSAEPNVFPWPEDVIQVTLPRSRAR